MAHPIVILPLLFGAFALYGGVYHLVHYVINRAHREDLLFSAGCLFYFLFNVTRSLTYAATDVGSASFFRAPALAFGICALTFTFLFTFFFFRMRARLWLAAIGVGAAGAVFPFVLSEPFDPARPAFKNMFGHEVLELARHPLLDVALGYQFLVMLLMVALLLREYFRGRKQAAGFLAAYILLALLYVNDVLFFAGVYLSEYGVVFLLGPMSVNMALREKEMIHYQERASRLIVESQRDFQKSLSEHAEKLESRVEERTRELQALTDSTRDAFVEIDQLNQFSCDINSMTDMEEVIGRILNYITNNFGITSFWLLNVDHKKEVFSTNRVRDFLSIIPDDSLRRLDQFRAPLAPESGLLYKTYARKRPLYLRRLSRRGMTRVDRRIVDMLNLKGLLLVPLTIQGEVKAMACFTNYEGDLYLDRSQVHRIARFCDQIAGAVNSAALIQEIGVEREKSDRLLRNVLPDRVAAELKDKGEVHPEHFESVSVLFSDLVGFTRISRQKSAQEIISDLNAIFLLFDRISEENNLEKIKTIGDAYMAAGGLPAANRTHAIDSCLAALEIIATMKMMRSMHEELGGDFFEIRVGINTGSVMAGVVGKNKFAYDIFGDSVNVASRMESGGEPGRINISEDTYKQVSLFFECEYRGELNVKNRGRLHEYFLNRIRPELSKDEAGNVPNEKFRAMYESLKVGETIQHPVSRGLGIAERHHGSITVLELEGEINMENARGLGDRLRAVLASGCKNSVIDLGRINFIDSTGIATLIQAHTEYIEKEGRMVIINLPRKIAAIFQGLGVGLYETLDQALGDLDGGGRRTVYPEDLDFNMNFQQRFGSVILRLAGKLNYESSQIMRERMLALLKGDVQLVILNFRDLKSVDSSGLGAILFGHNQFHERGGAVRLVNVPENILELFRISHLESMLEILPDEDAALADAVDAVR